MAMDSTHHTGARSARAVLLVDGLGCLAAAGALAAAPSGAPSLAPLLSARGRLLAALGLTGGKLVLASRRGDAGALLRSAAVNLLWAVGCGLGLRARHTPTTRTLVAITGAADLGMAIAQGALAARRHRR